MKSSKILFVFILAIFLISFVDASDIGCANSGWQGYGKLNENKTIQITCPTCDFINISSTNPNGDIFLNNVGMSKDGVIFSYTFLGDNLNILGNYQIDGYSQLDEPLGLCFEVTLTGKSLSIGSYIISIIFILLLFVGVILLNIKFNEEEREKLYNKIVIQYFKFKTNDNKGNLAYAVLFTIAYAILKMIFVLYYLVILLFLFIFNELVTAYSINTFATLLPQIINIALYFLTVVGFVFIAILVEVLRRLMKQIGEMIRGVEG